MFVEINKKDYSELAYMFSRGFTAKILDGTYMNYLDYLNGYIGLNTRSTQLIEFIDQLFKFLSKNYRCEYIYKNAIASKILLGRHSLNTSVMFNEMIVGQSKADLVLLNGTSTVYEIKTELDSLDRLKSQIDSYLDIFDYTYVVTYKNNIDRINKIIPQQVGIIILSDKYTLRTVKQATSNKENTNSSKIFDILRKSEYQSIIKNVYGKIPNVPNTLIYQECKKLFAELKPIDAHDHMVNSLKKRKINNYQKELVEQLPDSLKLLALYENYNKNECNKIREALFSPF